MEFVPAIPSHSRRQAARSRPRRGLVGLLALTGLAALAGDPAHQPGAATPAAWDLWGKVPAVEPWDRWWTEAGCRQWTGFPEGPLDPATADRPRLLAALTRWVYGEEPDWPVRPVVWEGPAPRPGVRGEAWVRVGPKEGGRRLRVRFRCPAGEAPWPVWIQVGRGGPSAAAVTRRGWLWLQVGLAAEAEAETGRLPRWSRVARSRWRVERVLDALAEAGWADREQVVLCGSGFGGVAALWTAAADERVAAVLSVDAGPGGACRWRDWGEDRFGPGIEGVTRAHPDRFSPWLRLWTGREGRLPAGAAAVLVCLAPRAVLVAGAAGPDRESAWAVEQAWREAREAIRQRHPGAEEALGLDIRDGAGAPGTGDWARWIDWIERRLGRRSVAEARLSGPRFWSWSDWRAGGGRPLDPAAFAPRDPAELLWDQQGQPIDSPEAWRRKAAKLRARIGAWLGPTQPLPGRTGPAVTAAATASKPAPEPIPAWLHAEPLALRPGLTGVLVFRTNILGTARRLPALVWLHPWSVPTGHRAAAFRKEEPWLALARSGSVVLAFDQAGCGSRLREGFASSPRPAGWTLLGQMVADARAAVAALAGHRHVDPAQIYLLGCGEGAVVAAHAAALDERVAGALLVGGFPPMRAVGPEETGRLVERLATRPPLLPQLIRFAGQEASLPWDFTDLLALTAPRPVLVVAPRINDWASVETVRQAVDAARPVYRLLGGSAPLVLQVKEDYNHFTPDEIWCLCGDEAQR